MKFSIAPVAFSFLKFNNNNNEISPSIPINSIAHLQSWFTGVFDNIKQVNNEKNIPDPRDKHYYVTANFTTYPNNTNAMLASYYYGTNTSDVFRFRYYKFQPLERNDLPNKIPILSNIYNIFRYPKTLIQMKICRPSLLTISKLKANKYDLSAYYPNESDFEYIPTGDILWQYIHLTSKYEGSLLADKCIIYSQINPAVKLTAYDNLTLRPNSISIKDRVYNDKGQLIIGNRRGIPYDLQRI